MGVRFLRADGELIGTVGGPEKGTYVRPDQRSSESAPASDGEAESVAESGLDSADSRESGSDQESAPFLAPTNLASPAPATDPREERDAYLALRVLEHTAREAKALLRVAVAAVPGAPAEELVRAALLRCKGPRPA